MKKVYIYALSHPKTGEIRYIGKTTRVKQREFEHKRLCILKRRRNKKNSWCISLINKELSPVFSIIEESDEDNGANREVYWISYLKSIGMRLLNQTGGGEGQHGRRHTKEHKEKISISCFKKNRVLNDEAVLNVCSLLKKGFSVMDISIKTKLSENTIYGIRSGRRYRSITEGNIDYQNKNKNNAKTVILYDKNMNEIKKYNSVKEYLEKTNCSYQKFKEFLKNNDKIKLI